jgi:hypothetical protein
MVLVGAGFVCNKASVLREMTKREQSVLIPYMFMFIMKCPYCVVDAELDPVSISQEHAAS